MASLSVGLKESIRAGKGAGTYKIFANRVEVGMKISSGDRGVKGIPEGVGVGFGVGKPDGVVDGTAVKLQEVLKRKKVIVLIRCAMLV